MLEGTIFALSVGTIVSAYFYYLACSHIRDIKAEITSLKCMVHHHQEQLSNYSGYLDSISNSTKDRVKNLEIILHEFCSQKMPTVEEMEKLYAKLKREVTDHKKNLKKDSQKIEKSAEDLKKKVATVVTHIRQIDEAVDRIKQVNIDDFNDYRDMVEKEIKANNDAVFNRLQDIARDFHVLATKMSDGSFKEMKILTEQEYLKLKKV